MNLTDLANHICAQCGMNDTDDVSAAKMFLQRRLEMIWNTQLWRSSLIEATMTVNPDGSTTLADTVWIPSRATLLLPVAFDSVLAVRQDSHAMSVASLESYYRTDADWLNMQGDPTEFQILKPMVYEFATPQAISLVSSVAADAGVSVNTTFSLDGVTNISASTPANSSAMGNSIGTALQIVNASKPATTGSMEIIYANEAYLTYADYQVGVNDAGLAVGSIVRNPVDGYYYQLKWTPSGYLVSGAGKTQANGFYQPYGLTMPLSWALVGSPGARTIYGISEYLNSTYGTDYYLLQALGATMYSQDPTLNASGPTDPYISAIGSFPLPLPTVTYVAGYYPAPPDPNYWSRITFPTLTLSAAAGNLPVHQRVRLTTAPQLSVNLRVLGKMACPILGAYDTAPINNVEPCLMAFARGDMLLRQRQNGKAQAAAQEGASILAQLARSEAFQTANNFRIVPESGFGDNGGMFLGHSSANPL